MLLIPEININALTIINQNQHFYENGSTSPNVDAELARQRLNALNNRTGPRVGDFVHFPDEEQPRRFTYDWNDGSMQTTIKGSRDASFHIYRNGYCDFSGSLDSEIPIDQCHDTGKKRLGRVWFFSCDSSGPHRGVNVNLPFRVYDYWPVKVICPNCLHEHCEASRFCNDYNMRVCNGCFNENVFDFPCHICNTERSIGCGCYSNT